MKAFVRALLVIASAATLLHAADNDRAEQMTAARAEFFKADKVVRVEIEVDQSGMEALRKTPHPWFDRKVGKGNGPMNQVFPRQRRSLPPV